MRLLIFKADEHESLSALEKLLIWPPCGCVAGTAPLPLPWHFSSSALGWSGASASPPSIYSASASWGWQGLVVLSLSPAWTVLVQVLNLLPWVTSLLEMQWVFNGQVCADEGYEASISTWRIMCKKQADHRGRRRRKGKKRRMRNRRRNWSRRKVAEEGAGACAQCGFESAALVIFLCSPHLPPAALWGVSVPISQRP